jgi:cobalt-zinc-cadmium efflux system outer membrane protein
MRVTLLFFALCAVLSAQAPPEPITIEQAVQEALANNANLIAERMNVPLATARLVTARLRPNPVLTLDGDYLDVFGTGFSPANGAGPAEGSGRVDFVFEGPGKRAGRIAVAEQDRSAAELNVQNAIRGVIFDVQSAFVDVLLAKEALALAEQNLNDLDLLVEEGRKRVQAGELSAADLLRTRLAAMQFRNDAANAASRLHSTRHRLELVMGRRTFVHGFDVKGTLRRDPARVEIQPLRQQAQEMRPDILALVRSQARSTADLKLQLAQSKIDYTVGTQFHRQQSPTGTGSSLGVFLSVPLPVFNRNQGEIERARLEYRQLEARLSALRASVAAEVESSYEQYAIASTMLGNLETDMLEQSREVRHTAEESYRAKKISLLEFLDARRAYTDTMQSYNDARASHARSLYSMEAVTGKSVAGGSRNLLPPAR